MNRSNRMEVEILGRKWTLKVPLDPGSVTKAVQEVQARCEAVRKGVECNLSREDVFLLVSLNLAQELSELKADKLGLFNPDLPVDESR